VATLWRLGAVMETASLRGRSLIEPDGKKMPRSGCTEEKTNSMHQASSGSAGREAAVAHSPKMVGSECARSNKVQASPLYVAASAREREFRGSAPRALRQPSVCKPLSQSQCASSPAGSRLGLLSKRCLTPPSSRAPTASHRASATVQYCIFCSAGPASRRRCRLMSNVRRRRTTL